MSHIIKKKWYILQSFSGIENKVLKSLREHIKINNMEYLFGEMMIPSETIIEIKSGKKKKVKENFFQDIF